MINSPLTFMLSQECIPIYDMKTIRKQRRSAKISASRSATKDATATWAASTTSRPYTLADLMDEAKFSEAYDFFSKLSLADTKSECSMHGLPITGSKTKLFQALLKHAKSQKLGNPSRGVYVQGDAPAHGLLKASDAGKVRRALVADLRKGLVFDKKLKRGAKKMLKASYGSCSADLFKELFPHANGKKKVAVELAHLQIDSLGRPMRYNGSLELIPGSLSAQIDDVGTISVSGKYRMC
eukprot:CAMPEP_0119303550 /NCGR_PEP_ID=MMETSP1333-20130426/4971_1 /TAXON_ID=418940 /ORGANISM="Scyphosphaera apsteinii, Strain RCC1455" /LENGTH=238 /DNA_ID=CAMNT_0007306259 /DNA_START=35 /DNA_END=751 /DNA_ORIENTATION=+